MIENRVPARGAHRVRAAPLHGVLLPSAPLHLLLPSIYNRPLHL